MTRSRNHVWRLATPADLPAIGAIADQVHPSFPEDPAVFAERLQLYPAGVRLLELDGRPCGYLVSHPWQSGTIPALNSLIARIPPEAGTFYIHDLALLPIARGTGAARAIVEQLVRDAQAEGFATMTLMAVNGSTPFWERLGFQLERDPGMARKLASYGPDACLMIRPLPGSSEIRIRPVREADAPALAALLNEVIARGGTTALEEPFTPEDLAAAMLTGPEVLCCFVAEDATGALIGFQSLMRSTYLPADVGDIGTFTRVGQVQKGTGSRLFAATRQAAGAQGLAAINATIRADNAGGLAFYGRMGFQDHGIYPDVPLRHGTPVDRISKRYVLRGGG